MKRLVKMTFVGVIDVPREELESAMSVDPITDSATADDVVEDYVRSDPEITMEHYDFDCIEVDISRIAGEKDDLAEEPEEEEEEDEDAS